MNPDETCESMIYEYVLFKAHNHEKFLEQVTRYMKTRLYWYNNLTVSWEEGTGIVRINLSISPWVIASTLVIGSALLYSAYIVLPVVMPIIKVKSLNLLSELVLHSKILLEDIKHLLIDVSIDLIKFKFRVISVQVNNIAYRVLNILLNEKVGLNLDNILNICSIISGMEVVPVWFIESPIFTSMGGFPFIYVLYKDKAFVFKNKLAW